MINTVDIILIIILLAGTAIGAKRGFLKSIAGFVVLIASLAGAYFITSIISTPVCNFVQPKVQEYIENKISLEDIDPYGIPAIDAIVQEGVEKEEELLSKVTEKFVESAVRAICYLIAFLVLSIVLRLLLTLASDLLDKTPLKHFNGLLGAGVGLIETMVILYLAVYILSLLGVSRINDPAEQGGLVGFFRSTSPFALLKMLS